MSQSAAASIPINARAKVLRACLLCSIIQTPADFKRNGCPNCEEIMQVSHKRNPFHAVGLLNALLSISHVFFVYDLDGVQMKQSTDRVTSCTTTHFDGVIAVIDPEASWVARWQRTGM